MCEIFFLIAVTMCDLVHNVETEEYHLGLIFQMKEFQVLLVTEKCHVQSPYYTLGNAEQQLANAI